ncbi:MAG TPA: hypothetical protein DCF71_09835, partial [Gemmatimonadetes bacterium]|nr:hypothetical protein [Gemmatimonadota bacterium]
MTSVDNLLDLFSFEGRANRAWYFWHILLDDLVMFTLATVFAVLMFVTGTPLFAVPLAGVVIGGIWAGVAVTVKRLHDLDRPGWHWWLLLIPLVNIYMGLVLLFAKGTQG